MSTDKNYLRKLSIAAVILGLVTISSILITGQPASQRSPRHIGLPDDWSHHHLVFSNPGTYEQAVARGTYGEWLRLQYDTRFILQQMKRNGTSAGGYSPRVEMEPLTEPRRGGLPFRPVRRPFTPLKGDWSMDLGSGAKVGPGQSPAKYTFSPIATPDCNIDFVAFNTSLIGTSSQASIVAYNNLYTSGTPTPFCSGGSPKVDWAYNTNGGQIVTSPALSIDGTQLAFVQSTSSVASLVLLKWKNNSSSSPSGPVSLTTTPKAMSGCSTSGSSTTLTCTTGTFASGDVGTAISGTSIPVGTTITGYTSATKVTLSQAVTVASGSSETVSDFSASVVSPANYRACTLPCMTSIFLSGAPNDLNSAPFYDYGNDVLYVGDNSGKLHKFQNIFVSGAPGEVSSGWPVAVSGNVLTSPVLDSSSGDVFVADSGGFLYSYDSGGTLTGNSSQLAINGSKGIVDGPLVDSSAHTVYVFVGQDGSTATGHNCDNSTGCDGVFQFSITSFITSTGNTGTLCASADQSTWGTGSNCGSESVFGKGSASTVLYDGSFDQLYYNGSGGNLWTCGATPTPSAKVNFSPLSGFNQSGTPHLFIANGDNTALTSGASTCSPVTEIYNTSTSTDWIFLSVTANGSMSACTGPCGYSFNVTSTPSSGCSSGANGGQNCTFSASNGISAAGGTSAIVIDNVSSSTGASQIYFSTLANGTSACATSGGIGGCAVQASQATLH